MISERELWACAAEVMRQHGDGVELFVAERIGALALEGDAEGIRTWKAIARRVVALKAELPADDSGAH